MCHSHNTPAKKSHSTHIAFCIIGIHPTATALVSPKFPPKSLVQCSILPTPTKLNKSFLCLSVQRSQKMHAESTILRESHLAVQIVFVHGTSIWGTTIHTTRRELELAKSWGM